MGYRPCRKNFRWRRLEGDLLLYHPLEKHYLLVEVKGRTNPRFAAGESLTGKKRRHLRLLAEWLLPRLEAPLRVELFEVTITAEGERHARFRIF